MNFSLFAYRKIIYGVFQVLADRIVNADVHKVFSSNTILSQLYPALRASNERC